MFTFVPERKTLFATVQTVMWFERSRKVIKLNFRFAVMPDGVR